MSLIQPGINYWKYRSGVCNSNMADKADSLETNWKADFDQGVINNMLAYVGDISKYSSKEALKDARKANYKPIDGDNNPHLSRADRAWDFFDTMKIGDIIIACESPSEVLGIGRVTGKYYYCDDDGIRFHKRKVDWLSAQKIDVYNGFQQGCLQRFDLPKSKETLENILRCYADAIERHASQNDVPASISPGTASPSPADEEDFFADTVTEPCYEGALKEVKVNKYERSPEARTKCLKCYDKPSCLICGFNFEDAYGDIGKNFIHVHHLKPLSEIGEEYEVDPTRDLIPVCPNCHAMLHRKNNGKALTHIELMEIVAKRRGKL
jgi:hypothetical protein